MLFHDRHEAAGLLAEKLAPYRGTRPLVVGLFGGGAVMAREIADALGGDLDVLLDLAPRRRPAGRVTIAVGDGAAPAAAALRALREDGPSRLVLATAVARARDLEAARGLAEEVVCLAVPAYFGSLSRWFMDLPEAGAAGGRNP